MKYFEWRFKLEADRHTEKLKSVKFFIEATSCEQQYLWKEYHKKLDWEQDHEGLYRIIGHLDKKKTMTVGVTFSFVKLNGQMVCFYEGSSRFVDHTMIEEYLKENFPIKYDDGTRNSMTDASNFIQAVWAIKDINDALSNKIKLV